MLQDQTIECFSYNTVNNKEPLCNLRMVGIYRSQQDQTIKIYGLPLISLYTVEEESNSSRGYQGIL